MWCTRWYLPLLLLPLPTASPFFLVLFLLSLTMHAKPCFYCIILLTTLFISSCYWQPFPLDTPLSVPWSENISTFADALNATLSPKYTLPHPTVIRAVDRCWCDLTNGALFDPFNVSHWEYLSVLRLRDSLEKRQKVSEDLLRESGDPYDKPDSDLYPKRVNSNSSSVIWSLLRDLSPGFYNSFSGYLFHSEADSEAMPSDTAALPAPTTYEVSNTQTPSTVVDVIPPDLRLVRKEYDLRPYGFGIVLDLSWSR